MIPETPDVTSFFRLPSSIGPDVLTGPVFAANRELHRVCDADMLAAAEAISDGVEAGDVDGDETTDSTDDAILKVLKLAGTYLAGYYAAPAIAARLRTNGFVITESTGVDQTLRYATPQEVQQVRQQWKQAAYEALQSIEGLFVNQGETIRH